MAIRSTDSQAARMRASIGAVFTKPTAFDKWAKDRFDKMTQLIADLIDDELMKFGGAVAERAKMNIEGSAPSGGVYQIVDTKGNILEEWTASAPGQHPAILTNLLFNSIDFQVGGGGDRADFVEIGVFSKALWEYKTIAFYGPNEKHPFGRIVVGDSGHEHPVREYAKLMEEGGPNVEARPFLKPAFKEILSESRKDRQEKLNTVFKLIFGKKVPVSFRIYVGKEFQKSSK